MPLNSDILTPSVELLVNSLLGTVPRLDNNPYNLYLEMVQGSAAIAAGLEARILYGLLMMGDYAHSDENIQRFVLDNLANSRGAWKQKVAEMMSYLWIGHSFTLPYVQAENRQWVIDRLQVIDPRKFVYEGSLGQIDTVVYKGSPGGDIRIPYSHGIHLINQSYFALGGDPYGVSVLKRAKPYWDAFKLGLAAGALAAKRQAFPIMIGKTDTGEGNLVTRIGSDGQEILGPNGLPLRVPQGYSMQQMLLEMENGGVGVIDRLDDVMAIAQQTDGTYLFQWLHYLQTSMLLCFLVPETILGTANNGSGDSNLNAGHRETMNTVIRSQMEYISESLIESFIKPLLIDNFGEQEDYGSFPIAQEESADSVALLNAIANGITKGAFTSQDLATINRCRQLAGIEPLTELTQPEQPPTQPDPAEEPEEIESDDDPLEEAEGDRSRGIRSFFLGLRQPEHPPK